MLDSGGGLTGLTAAPAEVVIQLDPTKMAVPRASAQRRTPKVTWGI
jgi:hypothetical protein